MICWAGGLSGFGDDGGMTRAVSAMEEDLGGCGCCPDAGCCGLLAGGFTAGVVTKVVFGEAAGVGFAVLTVVGPVMIGVAMIRPAATGGAEGWATGMRAGGLAALLTEGWGGASAVRSAGCFPLQANTWTDSAEAS